MKYQMAISLFALIVSGACSGGDVTGAKNPGGAAQSRAQGSDDDESSARSGTLVVKKDCHTYAGQAGGICTITESTLAALQGATITYESAAVNGLLNSDVILDPAGPGKSVAFGHCTVNLATGLGECSFSGGTGKFTHFHASVAVTPLGWPLFAWNGTYSYGKD
jgi:hypothetical protein